MIVVGWLFGTHLPRAWADSAWSDPLFLVILVGLALVAIGAISSALASAVPGRERAVRAGFRIGVLGSVVRARKRTLGHRSERLRVWPR